MLINGKAGCDADGAGRFAEGHPIDRRGFLAWAGVLFFAVSGMPAVRLARATEVTSRLLILGAKHPKAFVFRQAEVLANLRSYSAWEAAFRPLGGVVAKLLREERTDTVTEKNLTYLTRFKQRYPHKLALLHLNGRARLPQFETEGWFAGWWLYRAGTTTVNAVDAAATSLGVNDSQRFSLTADAFGESWEDLVITLLDAHGRPDFTYAEHVRLVAIDHIAGTLHVERGQYGSQARSWPPGSYVAAHVAKGPWFPGGNKVWLYNYTPVSPRDAGGLHVIDAILAGLQPRFAPGGSFAFLDGIQLDAFILTAGDRQGVDADGDGIADAAFVNGVDTYTLGLVNVASGLRDMLGPARLLLTDGQIGQRPDVATVNGVELEGVPRYNDIDQLKWSQALEVLRFFRRAGRTPALSYAMYKFSPPLESPAKFSRFRLALAAALLTNTAFTFFDEPVSGSTAGLRPGPDAGNFLNRFTIWDELLGGNLRTPGWLGKPVGPPVHLTTIQPDLYNGDGITLPPTFVADITTGKSVIIRRYTGSVSPFLGLRSTTGDIAITLPAVSVSGPDLTLLVDAAADPLPEFPVTVPRNLTLTAFTQGVAHGPSLVVPVDPRWASLVLAFRRLPAGYITLRVKASGGVPLRLRRLRVVASPDLAYREFEHGAVFANPSDSPATFDVAALFPTQAFRRLAGSVEQDPMTNNGQLLGTTLTIPAIDALVVARV